MENLKQVVQALIFASEQSIRIEELQFCLQATYEKDIEKSEIEDTIRAIRSDYSDNNFAIELIKTGNGYQFLTKKEFHPAINQLLQQRSKKKLSQAAVETLAIVAYKQPITRVEIEQIRGVNCDYTLQKLLDKELITISGKSDTVGKPLLYTTGQLFMDYFGINNLADLPHVKDIAESGETIGDEAK
ncbi:SMC-Scp complex subunit ScpB [Mucilaginibacter ginkgonis]|uniref:SMC-Scp complex subunit ScpB n=1 Tax=Mucilaginibacter ginkgonis TaxID=2682091 RepID=A0A6I4I330_9SPHI|nr:SMC-Scp complex subunit ScpB [Mucilaginibacter ginkgonis]QQL48376.1 SMC-Scp complex subunit ScpB [Mucilaginibacter ginkgonis]